eukprot:5430_1
MCSSVHFYMQFVNVSSFIAFNACYFLFYQSVCLNKDPFYFWKDSLGWIFQGQFVFEIFILLLIQCRKYIPRICSLVLNQIILSIYIIINVTFAVYILVFRNNCLWNSYCVAIDSLWNGLWALIVLLYVTKILKNTKQSYSFRAVSQSDIDSELSESEYSAVNEPVSKEFITKSVAAIMKKVDRADFAPRNPYQDKPQSIGYGATISAPHMHARALEALFDQLQPGCVVLDVGSGSGYLSACMAYMVGKKGKVIGIEHIKELCELGIKNINKNHSNLFSFGNLKLMVGDGRKGYSKCAPYNCIHVGATAQPNVANVLCKQLKFGGKMVIPVQIGNKQKFRLYVKDKNGNVSYKDLLNVRYVPLTDEKSQRNKR